MGIALVAALALAPVAQANATVDRSSRSSVRTTYLTLFAPAIATPTGWTGSVVNCNAGTTSTASQKATLTAVNYVRALAGLSPVKLSASYTAKAQKAAEVFKVNSTSRSLYLTHALPSTVKCYSNDARIAAAHSNLAASTDSRVSGAKAVIGYLDDLGASNHAVGHRRWLLSPDLGAIGAGSTSTTNALYVAGASAKTYRNPSWVTWPTSGYFPSQLEPSGRWSISGKQGLRYDFSKAKITVVNAKGTRLKVTKYALANGMTYSDTVVFAVSGLTVPKNSSVAKYTVTISGVKHAKKTVKTYRYTVSLFDPTKG